MIEVLETIEEVPQETEHKVLIQAKRVLHFFGVDTAQWDSARTIKWILSKLALIIVVLGLGVYTFKTSWALIQDYAQSPSSYIGRTSFNQSIALPPSLVGLPLDPYELNDYWVNSINGSSLMNTTHYQNLLFNFFSDTKMTNDTFLSPDYHWPNFLLFVTYHYLDFIWQFESLNRKEAIQNTNSLSDSNSDLMAAITILDDRLKNLQVSTSDMITKFGAAVKALFKFAIFYDNSSSELIEVEVDSQFSSFEHGYIWYNVRFDQHPLKKEESFQIQAKRSDIPNPRSDENFQLTMKVGIGGLIHGQNDFRSSWFDSWATVFPLQVASAFHSLSYRRGKQRCNEYTSMDLCIAECRKDYFRQKCGCFSTFGLMESANSSETMCYLENYMTCFCKGNVSNNEKTQEYLIQCEDECLYKCVRTTYFSPKDSYYSYPLEGPLYKLTNYAVIVLTITSFDYPIFEETMKWTFPSFFGTIGGAIGLWLGINILGSISYADIGVKALIKGRKKKSAEIISGKSGMNQGENSDNTNETHENSVLSFWKRQETAIQKFCIFCNKISKWAPIVYFAGVLVRVLLGFLSFIISGLALKEYIRQRTATNVYVNHNESMKLPVSTICLPLELGELSYQRRINYDYITYISYRNVTKDDFVPENERWHNIIRNIVHAYLIFASNCEFGYDCNRPDTIDKNLTVALDSLEIIMLKLDISIDELRQKFGREVAALYSFQVALFDFDEWVEKINLSRTNFIDSYYICYEIQFDLYPLKTSSFFGFEISEQSLPNPWRTGSDRKLICILFGAYFFSERLRLESNMKPEFGKKITYTVELSNYHTLREVNGGEERCSELSLDKCETACRIKFILEQCKCLPTLWSSLLEDFSGTNTNIFGDLKRYYECPNISGTWDTKGCALQCLRPCERLAVTVKDATYFYNFNPTQFFILLDNMNIVTFEEQLTWTSETFMGIIGGTVDFLLGYTSFDIVCFAFILLMKFCIILQKKAKIFTNKSQIAPIEVRPAPGTSVDDAEANADNAAENSTIAKFGRKLNKIGWKFNNPQWLVEHIFKLIVIVFFGFLTVKMCIPIIRTYAEGATVYVINLTLNEPLQLKPATLCIKVYPDELDDMMQAKSHNFSFVGYEAKIQQYFRQPNITKETFLDGMNWTNTLIYITYAYFSSLSEIESAINEISYDLTEPSLRDSSLPYFYEIWGKDKYTALTLVEQVMLSLNISANELRQRLAFEVAKMFSINAYQSTNCQGYSVCQNETRIFIGELTAINWDSICYRMPFNNYPFKHPKQSLVVTANSKKLPNKLIAGDERMMQIYLSGKNNSNFYGRIFENGYLASSSFAFETHIGISISAIYQSMISLGKCSEYKTHENCVIECRVALFRQMCNCTPVTWSSWTTSNIYEECSLNTYLSCAKYNGDDDIDCVKERCGTQGDLCERWVYNVEYLSENFGSTRALIALRMGSLDYPVFTEQYKLPFEEFIGALGGATGFYLPLDLLQILIFLGRISVFLGSWLIVRKNRILDCLQRVKLSVTSALKCCTRFHDLKFKLSEAFTKLSERCKN